MSDYRYTECGLENVFIRGAVEFWNDAGEESFTVPAIGLLHKVIAEGIVARPAKMTGQEAEVPAHRDWPDANSVGEDCQSCFADGKQMGEERDSSQRCRRNACSAARG